MQIHQNPINQLAFRPKIVQELGRVYYLIDIGSQRDLSELTEPTTRNGLKQGDGLAPLLFNIVLEYAIRKSNISTDGTLIFKSIQIAAYADDVNIMARTQQDFKNTYILLEQNTKKVGVQINTTNTKVLT
jgi:hypothetical protein